MATWLTPLSNMRSLHCSLSWARPSCTESSRVRGLRPGAFREEYEPADPAVVDRGHALEDHLELATARHRPGDPESLGRASGRDLVDAGAHEVGVGRERDQLLEMPGEGAGIA